MFNNIKQGLNTVGQDLSYGAGLMRDQGKIDQQYNQLVAPQAAAMKAKKTAVAAKMKHLQPKPSYMDSFKNNIANSLTSTGRDSKYLQ